MYPSQLSEGSSGTHLGVTRRRPKPDFTSLERPRVRGMGFRETMIQPGSESDADRQPERPNLYSISIYESGTHLPLKSKA